VYSGPLSGFVLLSIHQTEGLCRFDPEVRVKS
jgi:hypothetical protein